MQRIILVGSTAYDRIMDYAGNFQDSFKQDKLHTLSVSFQVDRIQEHFGGCAGNVAYNLALLGEQPYVVSTAGSDFERYRQHLEKNGIDASSIAIDSSQLTAVAHIVTDRADNQIAAFALAAAGKPYEKFPPLKGFTCAMVSAGCIADMEALATDAKKSGVPVYLDPGQAIPNIDKDALRTMLEGCAGMFANDYELQLIVDKTGWNEQDILSRVGFIVTTLGEKGSRISTKEGTTDIPAVPAKHVVDPTGAGDAHRAGFLKGLLSGLPLAACAKLASATAVHAVEEYGTQSHSFTLQSLKERYQEAYGEKLEIR